eukprot:scaffold5997_cov86-Pinguiococcus_pyrenoidosus.AAC.1
MRKFSVQIQKCQNSEGKNGKTPKILKIPKILKAEKKTGRHEVRCSVLSARWTPSQDHKIRDSG